MTVDVIRRERLSGLHYQRVSRLSIYAYYHIYISRQLELRSIICNKRKSLSSLNANVKSVTLYFWKPKIFLYVREDRAIEPRRLDPYLKIRCLELQKGLIFRIISIGKIISITCSLLSRCWVKKALSPLLSPSLYRQMYFLISTLSLFLIPYGWSPMPHVLWHIDIPGLKYSLYGELSYSVDVDRFINLSFYFSAISICGVVLIVVAFFSLKPLEFCGMQEPINALTGTRLIIHTMVASHE